MSIDSYTTAPPGGRAKLRRGAGGSPNKRRPCDFANNNDSSPRHERRKAATSGYGAAPARHFSDQPRATPEDGKDGARSREEAEAAAALQRLEQINENAARLGSRARVSPALLRHQEARNTRFCLSQETFFTVVSKGVRNISDTL